MPPNPVIPYVLVNFSTDQVYLPKRKLLGQLIPTDDDNEEYCMKMKIMYSLRLFMLTFVTLMIFLMLDQENLEIEKKFITSPTEVLSSQKS